MLPSAYKALDGNLYGMLFVLIIITLFIYLCSGIFIFKAEKRKKIFNNNLITCSEVICIDYKINGIRHFKKEYYKYKDSENNVFEIKNPDFLINKTKINDKALLINFNDKCYSIINLIDLEKHIAK